ncbi:hypothetical protein [Nocardia carnea]|uniref:hypothetical protein n=1 Tax=Nocardia carnea TaxID=37328 RepID=UPI002453B952|nr:hypothetical protein [Nocardia carnea]
MRAPHFYPPDQATRVYGKGLVPPAPGIEETTRVFEPLQSAPEPTDAGGAGATRVYRRAPGPDDDAYGSDQHPYGGGEQPYEYDYRPGDLPPESLGPADPAFRQGEYAHGPGDPGFASDRPAYGPGGQPSDPYENYPSSGHPVAARADGPEERGVQPYETGYRSADHPMEGYGHRPVDHGSRPDDYGYRPEDETRRVDDRARAYGSDERAYPPGERAYGPDGAAGPATGDWWTAERGDPSGDGQPAGPVRPGPGGLFGYGGADVAPGAPPPDSYVAGSASGNPQSDPFAAAYEAGYRDSYLANAARPPESGPEGQRSRTMPILAGAGVFLLVVLIAILGFTFLGSGDEESPSAAESTGAATTAAPRSSAPATSTAPARTSSSTTTTRADLPSGAQPCTAASGGGAYGSAATGTAVTSCEFAEAVRQAYLDPAVVSAEGEPVSVEATSPVTGQAYTLECVAADGLVTCRGGNNAVVYLY